MGRSPSGAASRTAGRRARPANPPDPMSKTQYYAAATLDGYIAEADDTLGWLLDYDGSYEGGDAQPIKGSYEDFYDEVGALVSGSTTYEWVLDHMARRGA